MNDTISRQAAIDALENLSANYTSKGREWHPHIEACKEELMMLPPAQPEPLTDKEQRIFLSAIGREEKVCEEVDRVYVNAPHEGDSLVRVCREIKRKVIGALWT